jgi:L-threonine kinase
MRSAAGSRPHGQYPLTTPEPAGGGRRAVVGYGKSFASFGEVVQGRTSKGEDFLVTLPVDKWCTCELVCTPIDGPLVVECDLEKSQGVLYQVLDELGISYGYHLGCNFTRNIPIGKGLSSSTADMLAALRALQEVFGFLLTESFVSRIFSAIEPHDALHYGNSVAYNHRRGHLIENYGYVPAFTIVAVDDGGMLDTLSYNSHVSFTESITDRFDELLRRLGAAYKSRDDLAIAACATESARIHLERTGKRLLQEVLAGMEHFAPLGLVATHSGTCAGLLFSRDIDPAALDRLCQDVSAAFGREVFATRTLRLLA